MSDPSSDFVPIEPTPAVAPPAAPTAAPASPAAPPASPTVPPAPPVDPSAAAVPPPPPGYYPSPQGPGYPPQAQASGYPQAPAVGYPPQANGYPPQAQGYGAYPPGYDAYPPGYGYPGQYAPAPPPSGLAIAAMVLGIAGVVFGLVDGLGLFPAIAAIITGNIARKRQPYARGFWLTGLITGYVGLALSLIVIAVLVTVIVIGINGGFDSTLRD